MTTRLGRMPSAVGVREETREEGVKDRNGQNMVEVFYMHGSDYYKSTYGFI